MKFRKKRLKFKRTIKTVSNMSKLLGSLILIFVMGAAIFLLAFSLPSFLSTTYISSAVSFTGSVIESTASSTGLVSKSVVHIETPEPLKALYMTACVAGTPAWRTDLKNLIETTELNAIIIDIKGESGKISFPNNFPKVASSGGCLVNDLREFIEELHESEIYVIGRISVFQDASYTQIFPELAVKKASNSGIWKDFKGLSFIDVGAKPYWEYVVNISKEAYAFGFDEINYDYVRYPSDGNLKDVSYSWTPNQEQSSGTGQASSTQSSRLMTKAEILKSFFKYLHDNMKNVGVKISVDLFGMTTTVENDMGIGQLLENALPYFDYVSPMVYPSHYPAYWNGFVKPAEHPYQVIKIAMTKGVERERAWNISNGFFSVDSNGATTTPRSKLRPWLQDFHLGATYGPDKVRAQIQATYDVGLTSWVLWNAANKYTKEALLPNE